MSFSSTPLGQGRRLDHSAFLNKPRSKAHSPPRRTIPTTYAYGGPTLGTRPPPKSQNPPAPAAPPDDAEEPALVRFARLKQREQAGTSAASGPQSQTSPHPEKWSVKDTSVNIASAFHTAANTDDNMNPNDSWASGTRRQGLPRSTSVEYEKETQSTVNRRLAPPPSRTGGARKPLSKAASIRHVPDSEGEQTEPSQSQEHSRGKSPLEHFLDAAQRFAPTSILMKARSREPEADQSRSRSNGNGAPNESSSYDYSAEERDYQAQLAVERSAPTGPRRNTVAHKRNRMSTDNKAYKPTQSDLELSDEDFDDEGGKRTRRKKKKGGVGGPPLTSLPVAAYDKRKKKRRANGKTNGDDEDEESSEEQEAVAEQRSVRGQTPLLRLPSVQRGSHPPASRTSMPPTSPDDFIRSDQSDPETMLPPIREIDEDLLVNEFDKPPRSGFSIGATLGRVVNAVIRLGWMIIQLFFGFLGLVARFIGKVLGLTLDVTVHKPFRWLSHADFTPFLKAVFVGAIIYFAWSALHNGWVDLSKFMPSSRTPYHAPDAPVTDIGEYADRLMRLEAAFSKFSQDSEKSQSWIEGSRSELVSRVGAIESQVQKETVRTHDAETKFRTSTSDAIQVIKQEMDALQAQLAAHKDSAARSTPAPGNDDEARAKLRALEERLGSTESGVKEALELGKTAAKVGASTGTAAAWWSKLASGNAGSSLTIKSTDGQDVTSLVRHLVDTSVYRMAKDVVARPDYALYSAGAQVIPALTTQTYEIPPGGLISQVTGFFTGGGTGAIGRPPVTALHHEINPGHCWPFPDTHGQLGIKLAGPTFISDVTIDHVAKELAPDRRSAPRYMELWGLVEGSDNLEKVREWRARREEARMEAALDGEPVVEDAFVDPPAPPSLKKWGEVVRVANFTYNIYAPDHIQTFAVPQEVQELGVDFGVVALMIENNWGRDDFTCLYRVRVHGQPLLDAPAPLPEDHAGTTA